MLGMSRMVSVIMLLVYGAYLFFQLKTHTFLFEGEDDDEEGMGGVRQAQCAQQ